MVVRKHGEKNKSTTDWRRTNTERNFNCFSPQVHVSWGESAVKKTTTEPTGAAYFVTWLTALHTLRSYTRYLRQQQIRRNMTSENYCKAFPQMRRKK